MARRPLSRARRLVFGMIVAGLVFLVAEGAVRVVGPELPDAPRDGEVGQEPAMLGSALLGWEPVRGQSHGFGVPSATWINQLGTRNPELGEKAPGTLRLMSLGDSTVYGVLVSDPDVFVNVAAKQLSQRTRRRVEPVNGGIPGYSSEQSKRLFRDRLAPLEPDYVLIATLWSDAQRSPMPDAIMYAERSGTLRPVFAVSSVYRLVEALLLGWRPPVQVAWRLTESGQIGEVGQRVPEGAYRDNLTELAERVRAAGGEPVFLLLPSDRDLRSEPLEAPRPAYRAIMREVAEAEGALLIDGASPFVGKPASYMFDDVHPSPAGHRLLGQLIAQALVERIPQGTAPVRAPGR